MGTVIAIIMSVVSMDFVDIQNVRKKSDRVIRISSDDKRNLMNGILESIENQELQKPLKKITWKDMTNVRDNSSQNVQHPQKD